MLLCHRDDLGFVFGERQNGDLDRRHLGREFQNDARLAFVVRLFGVRIHHHREQRAVDADRRLDHVRIKTLVRLRVKI